MVRNNKNGKMKNKKLYLVLGLSIALVISVIYLFKTGKLQRFWYWLQEKLPFLKKKK